MLPTLLFDAEVARALILLMPVVGLGLAFWIKPPSYHQLVAILLGILWNIPYVLLLNIAAVEWGWWNFAASPNTFYAIPIELVLGWAIFWGGLLPHIFQQTNKALPISMALFLDLLFMPELSMLFSLGEWWLLGDAILLLGCLLPALIIYDLTTKKKAVLVRGIMQAIIWAGWNIFLIPAIILSYEGKEFFSLLSLEGWRFTLFVNTILLAMVIGYAALYEFAKAGEGTPLPFDPPQYLVTTGPYAYITNPLQISAFLIFVGIAIALESAMMVMGTVAVLVFSEGFVRWHHEVDIAQRFGVEWLHYKRHVRNWLPRWKPYVDQHSIVYFSQRCEICQDTEWSLRRLKPVGIEFTSAPLHPSRDLERVTYRHYSARFEESGIRAIARIFEQVNLSFAILGWLMRLPVISQILQIIVDGSGERDEKVARA